MRVVIVNSDPERFLAHHYGRNPHLAQASYSEQMAGRYESFFGVNDFYSRNFRALGHDAVEIYTNNLHMQRAWAREHGVGTAGLEPEQMALPDSVVLAYLKRTLYPLKSVIAPVARELGLIRKIGHKQRKILASQIEEFDPDLILVQDIMGVGQTVKAMARKGRTIVVQHGVDLPRNVDLAGYDAGVSMLSWVVERFRAAGLPAEQVHLAFEPSVLNRLGPQPERDIPVSFVGSIGTDHGHRLDLLEAVAERSALELWTSDLSAIPPQSRLRKCYRGEVWGRDMYDVLRRSRITLNSHGGAARGMAANMRLYEATGVGTLLVTDNQANLSTLFDPQTDLVPYNSAEDCAARVERYLAQETKRARIASCGQAHTLATHTYRNRVEQLLAIAERHRRTS